MSLDFNDLGMLSNPNTNKGAIQIDIDLIDEDPEQPRTEFNEESLNELADTIKDRGVKSPISVHIGENGRYIINHGARRYRASKLAGKTTIPAFIDEDYNSNDQFIENVQRDNLSPMDIARFLQKQKELGLKQKEIAKNIGKAESWVSRHLNLLNLPQCIKDAMDSGKIGNDYLAIDELKKLYEEDQQAVEAFLGDKNDSSDFISRNDVKELSELIHEQKNDDQEDELLSNDIEEEESDVVEELDEQPYETVNSSEESNSECDNDDLQDLDSLDSLNEGVSDDSDIQPEVYDSVKEIKCVSSQFGEVTVVFRNASQDGYVVVLTDDGVKEVLGDDLTLRSLKF